jgi:hypothetical protein
LVDLKIGGIVAAAAFVLSFAIGLVSQAPMPFLIIRPLIFALLFFLLSNVAKILLSHFMPELLEEDPGLNSNLFPGSMINIMESDTPAPADAAASDAYQGTGGAVSWQASNAARPDDSEDGIGDIASLTDVRSFASAAAKRIPIGLDQKAENGYTDLGDMGNKSQSSPSPLYEADASNAAGNPSAFAEETSGSSAGFSASDEILPDLDSMTGVFSKVSSEGESDTGGNSEPPKRKASSQKGPGWEGDFSPKELSEGLRTILKKDKEG